MKASPQAPKLANTFNNDGSFLEQFKKMNETKNPVPLKPEPFRAAPVKVEPSPIAGERFPGLTIEIFPGFSKSSNLKSNLAKDGSSRLLSPILFFLF